MGTAGLNTPHTGTWDGCATSIYLVLHASPNMVNIPGKGTVHDSQGLHAEFRSLPAAFSLEVRARNYSYGVRLSLPRWARR